MQSPSSLIFLVLLGVWAAYFAQYWLRRRDHLATARSVEQFSEAMRVLERRPALPRTDLSEPAPRSYAVHPARTARPQVIVKRAVPAEPLPTADSERRVSQAPKPSSDARRSVPHGVRPRRRPRPSRRIRGLVLLGSLVALLVVGTLVALSILPLWAPAPAGAVVVAAFLWVRSAVRAEHAERALTAARRRRPVQRPSSAMSPAAEPAPKLGEEAVDAPVGDVTTAPGGVPAAPGIVDAVAPAQAQAPERVSAKSVPVETADATVPEPGTGTGGGRVTVPEALAEVMVPIVDEDDIPDTWDPVPVPRPTYTMKAKAERPEVEPAATTPDPVRHEGSGDAVYDQRRVAGA